MEEGWMQIYSSSQLYEIEMIQSILLENDIKSIIINKKDSFYLFGDIELYVRVENTFEAKQIIEKHLK